MFLIITIAVSLDYFLCKCFASKHFFAFFINDPPLLSLAYQSAVIRKIEYLIITTRNDYFSGFINIPIMVIAFNYLLYPSATTMEIACFFKSCCQDKFPLGVDETNAVIINNHPRQTVLKLVDL